MKSDEAGFLFALVVIPLIIIPLLGRYLGKYGGGLGMFVTTAVGVVVYLVLFGNRLRDRGQMKLFATVFIGSVALSVALSLALWLLRTPRH